MTTLDGMVAFVTGSTSGMGLAIAGRFADEGATVVVNSRKVPGEPVCIGSDGRKAHHIAGDVSDELRVTEMIAEIEGRYGALDILVNNAGTTVFVEHDNLGGVSHEDWERILNVNVVGAWNTVRAAEKLLRASKNGVVINITSIAGHRPTGSSIPYAVSKAGLSHLTALLARALAPGIRVNGINPDGVVRGSGIFAGGWGAQRAAVYGVPEEELGAFYAQRTLLKREVLPEHVAAAVFALTGGDLSLTTGLHVPVDAGVAAAFLR